LVDRDSSAQRGAMCPSCGTELRIKARFCDECGAPVGSTATSAEYKQVTVLFADLVGSMDLAAKLGAERFREILMDVVNGATAVVRRYGGITDSFTGDGIMAVFGIPAALEDHALRGCLAALAMQEHVEQLAAKVSRRDDVLLQLRIGLNSGQVISDDGGSGRLGHTTIGEQVGLAQRMESVAPAGGVLLSEPTARLVEDSAVLADAEKVRIKGVDGPVRARRLLGIRLERRRTRAKLSNLVGREQILTILSDMLDSAIGGSGSVVGLVGPAGIGKSRLVAEIEEIAETRGMSIYSTYCESHAREIPFSAVARLLRSAFGVESLDAPEARAKLRMQLPAADPADLVLLEDTVGIGEPDSAALTDVGPDARRRRLTELVNAASLARTTPSVYVIEDVHWIDPTSEALLLDFLTVAPRTRSLVLITYRPEYRGELMRTPAARPITLNPLDDLQTDTLVGELLGSHPTMSSLRAQIVDRAAGNPFFAEELVRDLADRGVLTGNRGNYIGRATHTEVAVPATLQVAISSRIDRLDGDAKRTLNAAAVIGSRFEAELLACLTDVAALPRLVDAELVEQVGYGPRAVYGFRHPLIRTVAYRSQLTSERKNLHHRLADAIQRDARSLDENAALIAEHLEAAGDLGAAFEWHMRAGQWLTERDLLAARATWRKACQVADQLPDDVEQRTAMRISPRALLCVTAWRAVGTVTDTGFDELRDLTDLAGDKTSLAIGMAGQVIWLFANSRYRESSRLASDCVALIDSINDPTLTLGLLYPVMPSLFAAGEMAELLRLSELVVALADGDPHRGNIVGSPLGAGFTFRAAARCFRGDPRWKQDIAQMIDLVNSVDLATGVLGTMYKFVLDLVTGGIMTDEPTSHETAEILSAAERSGDDYVLAAAHCVHGLNLISLGTSHRQQGFALLGQFREAIANKRFSEAGMPLFDLPAIDEKARSGDIAEAIAQARALVAYEFTSGEMIYRAAAVAALVDTLLQRGTDSDVHEAAAAADQLAAVSDEPRFAVYEVVLLRIRALVARARGDGNAYRELVRQYRALAESAGFDGHIAAAAAMSQGA
jgi:adenylate cyclase